MAGKFEYQKKYDVNVCKQETSLYTDKAKQEAILFFFGFSEVNNTWLITSELANQRARKLLFSCVVYINLTYYITARALLDFYEVIVDEAKGYFHHIPIH